METKKLIDILQAIHNDYPERKIDGMETIVSDPPCMRVYWYTDNDGGHMDFYC